jgi:hypothetical protein
MKREGNKNFEGIKTTKRRDTRTEDIEITCIKGGENGCI